MPLSLAGLIREKIKDGRLPITPDGRVRGADISSHTCDACDEPIHATQAEYRITASGTAFSLHIGCHGLWEASRRMMVRS